MSRTAYHRDYYARTAAKRRKLASERRQCRRWCAWLLDELRLSYSCSPVETLNCDVSAATEVCAHERTTHRDGSGNRQPNPRALRERLSRRPRPTNPDRLQAAHRAFATAVWPAGCDDTRAAAVRGVFERGQTRPDQSLPRTGGALGGHHDRRTPLVLAEGQRPTRRGASEVTAPRSADPRRGLPGLQGASAEARAAGHATGSAHRLAPGRHHQVPLGRHTGRCAPPPAIQDRKATRDRDIARARSGLGRVLEAAGQRKHRRRPHPAHAHRQAVHERWVQGFLAEGPAQVGAWWRRADAVPRHQGARGYQVCHARRGPAAPGTLKHRHDVARLSTRHRACETVAAIGHDASKPNDSMNTDMLAEQKNISLKGTLHE